MSLFHWWLHRFICYGGFHDTWRRWKSQGEICVAMKYYAKFSLINTDKLIREGFKGWGISTQCSHFYRIKCHRLYLGWSLQNEKMTLEKIPSENCEDDENIVGDVVLRSATFAFSSPIYDLLLPKPRDMKSIFDCWTAKLWFCSVRRLSLSSLLVVHMPMKAICAYCKFGPPRTRHVWDSTPLLGLITGQIILWICVNLNGGFEG